MRRTTQLLMCVLVATVLVFAWAVPAFADYHYYQGNKVPSGAYGVKASIATLSTSPYVPDGIVCNWASNDDTNGYWMQCGWVKGNGTTYAPDGTRYPTIPTSYSESNWPNGYKMSLSTAQPLNSSRSYEVANIGGSTWNAYIQGALTLQRTLTANSSWIAARSEIGISMPPTLDQDYASFTSVQYKPSSTGAYTNFTQANWDAAYTWFYTAKTHAYQYITHANGL